MLVGVICMMLPEKKAMPVASVDGVVKQYDEINVLDTTKVEKDNINLEITYINRNKDVKKTSE